MTVLNDKAILASKLFAIYHDKSLPDAVRRKVLAKLEGLMSDLMSVPYEV